MIYIFDLGLPAAASVQAEVFAYLSWENEMMVNGKMPALTQDTVKWLEKLCRSSGRDCPAEVCGTAVGSRSWTRHR
jgi:hypothetical protein